MYEFGLVNCEDRMNGVGLKLIICMVCLVWELVSAKQHVECIERERIALLHFKSALFDPYGMLSSWTTPHCCHWKGIRCSNLTRHVLMLHLPGESHVEYAFNYRYEISYSESYVSGDIHMSLTELQHLHYLNLSGNSFPHRHIPEFLGFLANLISLDLSSCYFRGKIPTQFGSLSHLKYLNLASNYYLEGSIPPQLGNLSQLQHLDLRYNSFEGKIPSQLGNLSKLQYLDLSYNSFEGNIPSQLGNLSNLQELYLEGSRYYGQSALKIDDGNPDWLSNLISLTHLYMWNIPNLNTSHNCLQMIAKLPKLRQLSLSSCSLSDHFIFSLRHYKFNFSTSLSVLDLSENTFTSSMIFQWLSNTTSNLVELDLYGNLLEDSTSNHFGMAMNSLKHLDLSDNSLKGGALVSFANLCTLHSLIMSENNLVANLPSIFHDLSNGCVRHSLQELDLAYNQIIGSLPDLSEFSSLKTLDLSTNRLSGTIPQGNKLPSQLEVLSMSSNYLEGGVPKSFGKACLLSSLDLSNNSLTEDLFRIFDHLSGCSRYSLEALNLEENKINGMLSDLSILSSLKILILSTNRLSGKIPEDNILPSRLEYLSIYSNSLQGGVPKSFGNACALRLLDMSNNSLSEEFSVLVHHLSGCSRYSLEYLDLSMNQINGTLPELSMFSSLKELYLYGNKLNGDIPKDIQFPLQLETLYLYSNSLKGVFTDYHLANMSKLNSLDLSDNSLSLAFTQNWVPPFQLRYIVLRSCMLGSSFPKWLQTQNDFYHIDISNTSIQDRVPKWFWAKVASSEWISINISHNNLFGVIPNLSLKNRYYSLALGSNQFKGPIPPFLRDSIFLDLSKNKFTSFSSFLCVSGTIETLYQLDLSNNQLSGLIPNCWSHFKSLSYLDLSHNNFSRKIPTSMGSLFDLRALLLRNNSLTNNIPLSLTNCTKLVMLDMTKNKLSGHVPAWIGKNLQKLEILSLGMNHFYGSLPLEICYLRSIQLLDLSLNNLFGQIPACIKNFTSMTQNTFLSDYKGHQYFINTSYTRHNYSYELNAFLMWKGSEQMFKSTELLLLKSIDLSSNHFSEEIPITLGNLLGLISLNLSRNNLTGKIPSTIGKLSSLEFLDLSRNQFVGSIPSSLTQIDRLAMLDLSHNHLTGKIPTGTQLQSFNASSYEDNLDLCGLPLEKLCTDKESEKVSNVHGNEFSLFNHEFYLSMTFGFVISFWMVFGSILFKHSW